MKDRLCRVIVQQPALPKYRCPIFAEWANRKNIVLRVFFSAVSTNINNEKAYGFSAECVPMKFWALRNLHLMWHSAQWCNATRVQCDVLVLSWDVHYLSLIPSLLRARVNGVKTLLWGHGFSKNELPIKKTLRTFIGRLATGLVFYDHVTAKSFVNEGWDQKKIHVAPNSLDQEAIQKARQLWRNQPAKFKEFQLKHGLVNKKNIIYIGRIYKENRLDLLVSALPKILKEEPHTQVLVIGEVNECAQQLRELAESLGVGMHIKWLGAVYNESKIAPYMLSSFLFCYPANIGLSIMHAMGYGVPVITGNDIHSHNPEIHVLNDGQNGILFQHLSYEDLAVKISLALRQPEKLKRLGNNARESVLNGFTTEDMVDGFMSAVNAMIGI